MAKKEVNAKRIIMEVILVLVLVIGVVLLFGVFGKNNSALENIETNISNNGNKITNTKEELTTEIDEVVEELELLDSNVVKKYNNIKKQINSLNDDIEKYNEELNKVIETKTQELITSVEENTKVVNANLENVQSNLYTTMVNVQSNLFDSLQNVESNLGVLVSTESAKTNDNIDELRDELFGPESILVDYLENVQINLTEVSRINSGIVAGYLENVVKTESSSINSNIDEMEANVLDELNAIDIVLANLTTLTDNIGKVVSDIATTTAGIAGVAIDSNTKINNLTIAVDNIGKVVTTMNTAVGQIANVLVYTSNNVDSIKTTVEGINDTTENLLKEQNVTIREYLGYAQENLHTAISKDTQTIVNGLHSDLLIDFGHIQDNIRLAIRDEVSTIVSTDVKNYVDDAKVAIINRFADTDKLINGATDSVFSKLNTANEGVAAIQTTLQKMDEKLDTLLDNTAKKSDGEISAIILECSTAEGLFGTSPLAAATCVTEKFGY